MHPLEEDSSKSRRYWLREWRTAVGPCLICFGVPLLIPGVTITLVGLSYTEAIATYSALHVIGILLLAAGALCVVLGAIFLVLGCVCFNKVAPTGGRVPLRHVTTRDDLLSASKATLASGQEAPSGGGTTRRTPATSTPRAITANGKTPRETTRAGTSIEAQATSSRTAALSGGQSPLGVAAAVGSSVVPGAAVVAKQGSPPERPKSAKSTASSAAAASGTSDSSQDSTPTSPPGSGERGRADWETSSSDSGTSAGLTSDASSARSSSASGDSDSATGSLTRSVGPITLPDLSSVSQTATTARTLQSHVNFLPSPSSSDAATARMERLPPLKTPAAVSTVIGTVPPSPAREAARPPSPEFGQPEPLLRSGLDLPRLVPGLVQQQQQQEEEEDEEDSSDVTSASSNDDSEVTSRSEKRADVVIDVNR